MENILTIIGVSGTIGMIVSFSFRQMTTYSFSKKDKSDI